MENNYFIFTKDDIKIKIRRFHICTWEFNDRASLIEFGAEIVNPNNLDQDEINLEFHIPWISETHTITDLYENLKNSENSRFIFNDSVIATKFLDEGQQKKGIIQEFGSREPLCIMPITTTTNTAKNIVSIKLNLKHLNNTSNDKTANLYFRFYIEPKINLLSTRKTGISQSTIIYDLKINEYRNFPEDTDLDIKEINLCPIESCFVFNILPNSHDLKFFDSSTLQSIRTLEFKAFKKYLKNKRVKKDELIVVFNKKKKQDSYAFFSVFSKERIGAGQFALAILINLICGILLIIPSFRDKFNTNFFSLKLWCCLPAEVYFSLLIGILIIIYFIWPKIFSFFQDLNFKNTKKH